MTESILGFSEVLLFGRRLHDLKINRKEIEVDEKVRLATRAKIKVGEVLDVSKIDGRTLAVGDKILVRKNKADENGIYTIASPAAGDLQLDAKQVVEMDKLVEVEDGSKFGGTIWEQTLDTDGGVTDQEFKKKKRLSQRLGDNAFLEEQFGDDARLARIYGFSFEGTYYELPEPAIFLVHGKGESATAGDKPTNQAARAPLDPSVSGVASAEYQISNDIKVWSYDKADYSIRMDVMTGMLEQILLDIYFGFDSPAISGAKVSGAKVSGAKVSGAKVSGAKVSGAKVSGAKARGSD